MERPVVPECFWGPKHSPESDLRSHACPAPIVHAWGLTCRCIRSTVAAALCLTGRTCTQRCALTSFADRLAARSIVHFNVDSTKPRLRAASPRLPLSPSMGCGHLNVFTYEGKRLVLL